MQIRTFVCDICGQARPLEERTKFDGQELCARCLDEHTVHCRECGSLLWRDDNAGDAGTPLCQNCYEGRYTCLLYTSPGISLLTWLAAICSPVS